MGIKVKIRLSLVSAFILPAILLAGCNPGYNEAGGDVYLDSLDSNKSGPNPGYTYSYSGEDSFYEDRDSSFASSARPEAFENELEDYSQSGNQGGGASTSNIGNKNSDKTGAQSGNKSSSYKSSSASAALDAKLKAFSPRAADLSYYKLTGRAFIKNNEAYLPFSLSAIQFEVKAMGDITLYFKSEKDAFVKIYLNGNEVKERANLKGDNRSVVLKGVREGYNTVRIVRETGFNGSDLILKKIAALGCSLLRDRPQEYSNIHIEFIGGLNLMGSGVLLPDEFFNTPMPDYLKAKAPEYEAATLSYPFLVGKSLSADVSVIARQGSGIVASGLSGDISTLSELYDYMSPGLKIKNENKRPADFIVIDMDNADVNSGLLQDKGFTQGEVTKRTVSFILRLKKENPGVKIIWCYGLNGKNTALKNHIITVATILGGESENIYTLELESGSRGCSLEGEAAHIAAGERLTEKIKDIKGEI